jgi:hypothetical protein
MPKTVTGSKTSKKISSKKVIPVKKPIKKFTLESDNEDDELDEIIDTKTTKQKNKSVDKDETDDDFENKLDEIRQALKENYAQQKKLMNDLRELMTIHKKEIKLISKSKNRGGSGGQKGFNKPEPVPLSLKKLLKIKEDMLPRSKVTQLMYKYFTDNKMYNTKTKKEIIPNDRIKTIFCMEDGDVINFYNLQTWLKKVYQESNSDSTLKIED